MNIKSAVRKAVPRSTAKKLEESFRKKRATLVDVAYGRPSKKLKVMAVTGTNGKTTTCNYINDLLKSAGKTTALYTTATIEIAGTRSINTTHRTVPNARSLMAFFKSAKKKKVDFVILEITSHALHQHKVLGIPIEVAIMTNISQDHLDYHGTMEAYTQAKARLFNSYMKPKVSILNTDDEYYDYYSFQAKGKVLTYGQHQQSDFRISRPESDTEGSAFLLNAQKGKVSVKIPHPGLFNVYNATAAIAACVAVGMDYREMVVSAKNIQSVPGRLENVPIDAKYHVFVDYAHTPDALKNVLETMNNKDGKLWLVFGATGDRDKSKRFEMGAVAAKYADRIVLTDEETYSEDGNVIRAMVAEGINANDGKNKTIEISDRREAIKYAMSNAKSHDVILITGLGHQSSRIMGRAEIPWVESQIVADLSKEV